MFHELPPDSQRVFGAMCHAILTNQAQQQNRLQGYALPPQIAPQQPRARHTAFAVATLALWMFTVFAGSFIIMTHINSLASLDWKVLTSLSTMITLISLRILEKILE